MNDPGPESYALERSQFVGLLKDSYSVTLLIGCWFMTRGFFVNIPPMKISPSWQDRLEYSDSGDLFLYFNGRWLRVEIKYWPNIDFRTIEDVYKDLIVNAVNSWDNADPKPFLHIIVNSSITVMLCIRSSTQSAWFKKQVFDRRKNGDRWFYFCPREYAEVRSLSELDVFSRAFKMRDQLTKEPPNENKRV